MLNQHSRMEPILENEVVVMGRPRRGWESSATPVRGSVRGSL